ncbi:hypothetical protein NODU109028_11970 [Nocardioides dubius]|uniref:Uncharacterized protein n=1 Tax=Nocardioides dubius TaxID=317019 RepID=A0ABP4E946_9ACTN
MKVAVVAGAPALLAQYAGRVDPIAEVREACLAAVGWLCADADAVRVVARPADQAERAHGIEVGYQERVARELLAGFAGTVEVVTPEAFVLDARPTLLVADGSARRGEKAPGHLDERSFAVDEAIERSLKAGDPTDLALLDLTLAEELLIAGAPALRRLGELDPQVRSAELDYAGDPFGVRYWVARWEIG